MRSILFYLFICLSTNAFSQAERLVGYWKVNLVTVEQDMMTPVGKWFHLDLNGNLQGGNGGSINLMGQWRSDAGANLLFTNHQGQPDPQGPFSVSWENDQLILQREEESQLVKIVMEAFTPAHWPRAPWDEIAGGWTLASKESVPDKEELPFGRAFFRWDNSVAFNRGDEDLYNWTALWRIHAHQPRLELAPRVDGATIMTWDIQFSGQQMVWTRDIDGQQQQLTWNRDH